MPTCKYSFELKNDTSELKSLNRHMTRFGQANGLPETLVSKVNICLDELFTNTVLYGYEDDLEHIIRFRLNLNGHALIVNIEDDGTPFNPLLRRESKLPADIDEARIGGLGIHIVKKLMDDIGYERKRGINIMTLKKFVRPQSHLLKLKCNKTCDVPVNYFV